MAGHEFLGEGVGSVFVRGIVVLGHLIKLTALTRVAGIKGAIVKLGAFAQALDEGKTLMVHGGFHHGKQMLGIGVRAARHKGGSSRDGLLHRVDRLVHRSPHVRLALEADRAGRGGLFLGQAVHVVIHHHVGEVHVFAGAMVEVIAADGEGIAVAAEDKHIQILPRERDAGGKGQRAAVDIVRAVGLHKIREPATAADTGHGGKFLVMQAAVLDELEV